MKYSVTSEVGRLRQVILHRPGLEVTRLTPSNKDRLLFDDVLWLPRAQEEHDAFAETLRNRGVEVLYLRDLLAETLAVSEAQEYILQSVIDERVQGVHGVDALRRYTDQLTDLELAHYLIAGMTKRELLDHMEEPNSLDTKSMFMDDFVLNPLPNHLFTRDTSCWVYDGVAVNSMMMPARMRETVSFEAIYRWHPQFADADFHHWSEGVAEGRATIEGGDVLVIGKGAVLIGMSERTTPMGIERMARKLFAAGSARQVIAVEMPKERALMHLDTVMTMLDERSFIRYAGFGDRRTWVLEPTDSGDVTMTPHPEEDFTGVIADALGVSDLRIFVPPQDSLTAEREQWNDACNLLAIAPGVVVGYAQNKLTSDFLISNGIEVLDVPGSELGRGRGGPRCMSCPIRRDDI